MLLLRSFTKLCSLCVNFMSPGNLSLIVLTSASVCLSGNWIPHRNTHAGVRQYGTHTLLAAYYGVCLCSDKQEGKAISHLGAIKHCLIVSFIFRVLLNSVLLLRFTREPSGTEHSAKYKCIIICCSKRYYIFWCKMEFEKWSAIVAGYTVTSVEFQVAQLHRILMNFLWLVEEVDGCADAA